MKYLFIGGPWDGRREEVSGMRAYQRVMTSIPGERYAEEHTYRLEYFASGEKRFPVYVHDKDVPLGSAMEALLNGYGKASHPMKGGDPPAHRNQPI